MAKIVKIKTAHGTKVFFIKRSSVLEMGNGKNVYTKQRHYMVMDADKNCLALMTATTDIGRLTVKAVEVDGKFREYQFGKDLGNAATHEKMFSKIIKRVAKRAV